MHTDRAIAEFFTFAAGTNAPSLAASKGAENGAKIEDCDVENDKVDTHNFIILLLSFCVKAFVDFAEVRISDVSIDLGSGNIGVAEKRLDRADVGAVH